LFHLGSSSQPSIAFHYHILAPCQRDYQQRQRTTKKRQRQKASLSSRLLFTVVVISVQEKRHRLARAPAQWFAVVVQYVEFDRILAGIQADKADFTGPVDHLLGIFQNVNRIHTLPKVNSTVDGHFGRAGAHQKPVEVVQVDQNERQPITSVAFQPKSVRTVSQIPQHASLSMHGHVHLDHRHVRQWETIQAGRKKSRNLGHVPFEHSTSPQMGGSIAECIFHADHLQTTEPTDRSPMTAGCQVQTNIQLHKRSVDVLFNHISLQFHAHLVLFNVACSQLHIAAIIGSWSETCPTIFTRRCVPIK
ncbi:hypothetical protein T09_7617, partial [Trichinella sp. T9]